MDRFGGVLMAAGAVVKMALGFVGISLLAAAIIAPPEPGAPMWTESIHPARRPNTVTLRVPEGQLEGHLTVVDESSLQLAMLTRWSNGNLAVVARRSGPIVASWLNGGAGTASVSLTGTSRRTDIMVHPDGTTKAREVDIPGCPKSFGDLWGDGRGGAGDLAGEVYVPPTGPEPSESSTADESQG
jgi:hypothetical protein